MFSRSCVRAASVCHGYKLPSHHLNGQGEWRITGGCSMGQETCTCFGLELTPESMPGWPISKKKRKDPVPSTNDGCSGKEGWWFFFLMFSSLFPPSLPAFLFFSLTLSTWCPRQNSVGIPNEDYKSGSNGFLELCVRVCVCVCLCMYVWLCVCVCVSHLFVEQKCPSVSQDRHLAVSHWL